MADKNVSSLPRATNLDRDSLLVVEQQGEAKSLDLGLLQDFAKQGVDALVTAAQESATKALQAAQEAERIAAGIQDVSDDVELAIAAARAAENARAAAVLAQQAAEQAAALAAEQAASGVENKLADYVSDAEKAKQDAENAAGNAAANVENTLKGYVADAEAAKNAAQTAAGNAAQEAVQGVETKLSGYVADAEQAKTDAQSAAGTAATDAVNAVGTQMAGYVSSAQAAQKAAEDARDQAQAIAGGNFLPTSGGTMTGPLTLAGNPTEDLHAVPKRYVDNNSFPTYRGNTARVSGSKWFRVGEYSLASESAVLRLIIRGRWNHIFPYPAIVDIFLAYHIGNNIRQYPMGTDPALISQVRVCKKGTSTSEYYIDVYAPNTAENVVTIDTVVMGVGTFVPIEFTDVTDDTSQVYSSIELTKDGFLGEIDPNWLTEPAPIAKGGTGAASAEDALANLGAEKAGAAQLVFNKIISMGEQLVVNGNAQLGNNTGFSAWEFDGTEAYNSVGSFKRSAGGMVFTDDFFAIDTREDYKISMDMKSKDGVANILSFVAMFDADKNEIKLYHTWSYAPSMTKLAKDLVAGDTWAYVEDVSKWHATYSNARRISVWNYKNSFGQEYAPGYYTRNQIDMYHVGAAPTADAFDKANNAIRLASAYTGPTIPAGTWVSQGYSGDNYPYAPDIGDVPTEWTHYDGKILSSAWRNATCFCKVGFYWNQNGADTTWMTNVSLQSIKNYVTSNEMNMAITDAVGDINTILDEINGEVV